jgi:hypothetical protein
MGISAGSPSESGLEQPIVAQFCADWQVIEDTVPLLNALDMQ